MHTPSLFQLPVCVLQVRVRVPHMSHATDASPVHAFGQVGHVQLPLQVTIAPLSQLSLSPGEQTPPGTQVPSLFQLPVVMSQLRRRVPHLSQLTFGSPEQSFRHDDHVQSFLQLRVPPPSQLSSLPGRH
jgi:hypothetical protein